MATSRRKIRNRSYASRQIRQKKLDALLNQMQLTSSVERVHVNFNQSLRSSPLRRVKSLQATPSPTSVAAADSVFWTESTDQFETVYCRPIRDCCVDTSPPAKASTLQGKNWNLFCCTDTTSASALERNPNATLTSQQCDGYVDYQGNHHPHVSTNCQGCIYRQSLFDEGGACQDDELYYDSDYELYSKSYKEEKENHLKTPVARRSLTNHRATNDIVDDQLSCITEESPCTTEDSSPDRQFYMYDYFTRNQQREPTEIPLRTGVNATSESDVGVYVQASLC